MGKTEFTPGLKAMEGIKSNKGEILTKPFLEVCKSVLPVIDKLKDVLSGAVIRQIKSDIGPNIEWLEDKYEEYKNKKSNPEDYNLLHRMIEADVHDQNDKIKSVGVAVLRLTRIMDFLVQLSRNLMDKDKRGWTFCQACKDAYNKTLKQWQDWFVNVGFTFAMLKAVDREEFMKLIGCAGDPKDMKDFCSKFAPILEKNHKFLDSIGMNNLEV